MFKNYIIKVKFTMKLVFLAYLLNVIIVFRNMKKDITETRKTVFELQKSEKLQNDLNNLVASLDLPIFSIEEYDFLNTDNDKLSILVRI